MDKILYYVNQFFGQIGGEEKADFPPEVRMEAIGPAMGFQKELKQGKVVATFICGDNFFNENKEEALNALDKAVKEVQPDLIVAGPAFNAGRYGMACAGVAQFADEHLGIPVVTGMYEENPGLEACRGIAYVIPTGASAGDMRTALPKMAHIANLIMQGKDLKPAEGYFPQGRRATILVDKNGAQRAVEMLLSRLNNQDFVTELPMPTFDTVDPAPAIKELKSAVIAIVTSGGIVPKGNPDKIQSASAQKWGKYDISDEKALTGNYATIHGGYDPVYANECPDRVVPLDVLKEMEANQEIGKVFHYFYTTTGTGTSVGNSILFGKEIGKDLKEQGVDGVILTST